LVGESLPFCQVAGRMTFCHTTIRGLTEHISCQSKYYFFGMVFAANTFGMVFAITMFGMKIYFNKTFQNCHNAIAL